MKTLVSLLFAINAVTVLVMGDYGGYYETTPPYETTYTTPPYETTYTTPPYETTYTTPPYETTYTTPPYDTTVNVGY
jgi:hypothetical protein